MAKLALVTPEGVPVVDTPSPVVETKEPSLAEVAARAAEKASTPKKGNGQ